MKLKSFVVAALFIASGSVSGANYTFSSTVERVLVDDEKFAGCMVLLTDNFQGQLPNCGARWATMDCLKEFPESSGSIASNKLAQAQLALVTGRSVTMRVTDTRMANGYCFAQRIDVKDVR
ncbi:hypothetical protein N9W12_02755 [Luminiphilus sp.]|nr:hypothetical protein [Luminiphilus sp.]